MTIPSSENEWNLVQTASGASFNARNIETNPWDNKKSKRSGIFPITPYGNQCDSKRKARLSVGVSLYGTVYVVYVRFQPSQFGTYKLDFYLTLLV